MLKLHTIIILASLAAAAPGEMAFQTIDTPACVFKLCKIELNDLQQEGIVFGVECMQKTYEDIFGFTFPEDFKVRIVLFQEKQDFLEYQKKTTGVIVSESGYFSYKNREAVALLHEGFQKMVGIIFHEVGHMFTREQVLWCPNWLSEGLSEYFESLNLFDGERRLCLQEDKINRCKRWLKNGFPIEFEAFFKIKPKDWPEFNKEHGYAGYTYGYSIVYFLMTNTKTQNILKEILWDFKRNRNKADSVATINKFYPGGIRKLELHWKRWIPRARPTKPLKALIEKNKERKEQQSRDEQSP